MTLCAVDALRHVVAAPSNTKALLMAGGVVPLLRLLEAGPEHEVTLQSLWVLKVLARSAAAAEAIRAQGGLPLLAQLLDIGADSEATIQVRPRALLSALHLSVSCSSSQAWDVTMYSKCVFPLWGWMMPRILTPQQIRPMLLKTYAGTVLINTYSTGCSQL